MFGLLQGLTVVGDRSLANWTDVLDLLVDGISCVIAITPISKKGQVSGQDTR